MAYPGAVRSLQQSLDTVLYSASTTVRVTATVENDRFGIEEIPLDPGA